MKHEQFQIHANLEERHWWFLARREIMRSLVHNILPPSKKSIVLDVGCGTGGNIAALAADYTCIGLDPSEEAIRLARERFPGLQFICGHAPDALSPALPKADVLLLMDVLEHVADDAGFLSSLVKWAKPKSHILITVPADSRLWSQHDVTFGHKRRYDLVRFQNLLRGLPVAQRLLSYYNTYLYPLVKVMRALGRRRGRACGLEDTDFHASLWPVNDLLRRVFQSEAKVLLNVLQGKRKRGFARGVSLIALLRREPY